MLYWVISLESDYVFHLTLFTFITPHMHTRKCIANSSEVATRGTHVKCTSVPITFHRTLQAFTSTIPNMTGKSLDHPYIARVELTHGTPLPVRKCWEEAVQELAVVGLVLHDCHRRSRKESKESFQVGHRLKEVSREMNEQRVLQSRM